MCSRKCIYLLIFIAITFTACQKEPVISNHDYKTLGISAHDFLSSSVYTSLQIQISYMPGFRPGPQTIDSLTSFLNTYLNKPQGINISEKQIAASSKESLTLDEIVEIEKKNRTVFTNGNIITAHVLITNGRYVTNDVFAKSYWNTSLCLFGKAINDNSGNVGQISTSQLTTTLLEHEFGHLLGLVGQGTPMQAYHKDAANGAHCDNRNCLMYYNVETNNQGSITIPELDANCKSDLKANGGK